MPICAPDIDIDDTYNVDIDQDEMTIPNIFDVADSDTKNLFRY